MKCVEIDFDNTIAHFRTGSRDFFRIFSPYSVPKNKLDTVYETVAHSKERQGFTFEEMLVELERIVPGLTAHRRELVQAFRKWLVNNLVLYPDSVTALTKWHDRLHIPICIVTAGADAYQRQKVELVHVPHDEVLVVRHAKEKASATMLLLQRFGPPIALIDDKESELDAIRDAGISETKVLTVHIRRPDSPYRSQQPKYEHLEVESLTDPHLTAALR